MNEKEKQYQPKYVSIKVAKQLLQVHTQTLSRWADAGKIAYKRYGDKGHRLYDINSIIKPEISDNISGGVVKVNKKTICYCRVSSRNQKNDLQRQIISMRERYPNACIIEDIGSGINWKRKGLQSIIQQVIQKNVGTVVIHHRDRLCRFAYELIEFFFKQFGTTILVLDQDQYEPNIDQELSDDILSIIQVFSCKKMGRRRYKSTGNASTSKEIPSSTNERSKDESNSIHEYMQMDG